MGERSYREGPLAATRHRAMAETVTMMPNVAKSTIFDGSYGNGTVGADLSYR